MSCNINEYLSVLKAKKDEIFVITKMIEQKRRECEEIISKLNDEVRVRRGEIESFNDMTIPVRLGDLLDELSFLSGVNLCDISVSMRFNISFSNVEEFFQLTDNVRDKDMSYPVKNVIFELASNKSGKDASAVSFDYFTFLMFDMNDVQSDGKKLLEHCDVSINPYSNGELDIEFTISKDIQDVMCNFNLEYLESKDNVSWYPTDLFNTALINCVQRNYNSKVDKVRERVRTIN